MFVSRQCGGGPKGRQISGPVKHLECVARIKMVLQPLLSHSFIPHRGGLSLKSEKDPLSPSLPTPPSSFFSSRPGQSYCIVQTNLELKILPPKPPEC